MTGDDGRLWTSPGWIPGLAKGNEFLLFADTVHVSWTVCQLSGAYSRGFRNSTAASFMSPLDSRRRTRA